MSIIVALSGGKASFVAAMATFIKYDPKDIILYFNDTQWEHKDLYRFLLDIQNFFNHHIHIDSDGRSPEDVFYDESFLGNNRVPLCSRILKAERLQAFYKDGDTLIFGIGLDEKHRAIRIINTYTLMDAKNNKKSILEFPLIDLVISKEKVNEIIQLTGIKPPLLYDLGFGHNNCSGGCVRQGKRQWLNLLENFPDIYKDRERLENEFRTHIHKDVHFLKDTTLQELRIKKEKSLPIIIDDSDLVFDCIGVCNNEI